MASLHSTSDCNTSSVPDAKRRDGSEVEEQISPRGTRPSGPWRWLPEVGTWRYHALLAVTGVLVLGPLSGITAAYMNFSIGFVGSQVLAGIFGSLVTIGYGRQGRHGANLIQTAAASVAVMSAMAVLPQALTWLGVPQIPLLALGVYLLCIGMFGAGVGMLYTPLLVDRLELTFPSGAAVAYILRTITDANALKASLRKLGFGLVAGIAGSAAALTSTALSRFDLSTSTLGAGMVVGARIGVPALAGSLLFTALTPFFVSIGWLDAGEPYRKVAFLFAIGGLLGAATLDLLLMGASFFRRLALLSTQTPQAQYAGGWSATDTIRLGFWTVGWAAGVLIMGALVFKQPVVHLLLALALVLVFALVNGIALGTTDNNPISSAFVVTVLLLKATGVRDATSALLIGSIIFVATNVAGDMQQDRSTGRRLGTDRRVQFRYQVGGIVLGAACAVAFAQLFMSAYPVLRLDQTALAAADQPVGWTSAMTYKLVGVLHSLTSDSARQHAALLIGGFVGLGLQLARKLLKSCVAYASFVRSGSNGCALGWVVDAVLLPSPYALSFGGFVNLATTSWFAMGGMLSLVINRRRSDSPDAHVEESGMNAASLIGGGLIAGESLAVVALGASSLLSRI